MISGNFSADFSILYKEKRSYMSDELVRRCQNGDGKAFQELFRLHGDMIQKISMRMTRNADWQRDIFQDVVRQVIGSIRDFRGECKFTTWLYRITVNASLRFLQKENGYKNMLPIDIVEETHAFGDNGIHNQLERDEMVGHIMSILIKMPAENQNIISLFYFAERTIEEIANSTGKSEGAIKAVLWKGRKSIIKNLKKQGVFKQ
jgi:RNA polymerase sigma-70 factor (ECF subfamily)